MRQIVFLLVAVAGLFAPHVAAEAKAPVHWRDYGNTSGGEGGPDRNAIIKIDRRQELVFFDDAAAQDRGTRIKWSFRNSTASLCPRWCV